MDPLDIVQFHSVTRPGAATIGRDPEMRSLAGRSYLAASGVFLGFVALIVASDQLHATRRKAVEPLPIEVAIIPVPTGDPNPAGGAPLDLVTLQPSVVAAEQVAAPGHAAPHDGAAAAPTKPADHPGSPGAGTGMAWTDAVKEQAAEPNPAPTPSPPKPDPALTDIVKEMPAPIAHSAQATSGGAAAAPDAKASPTDTGSSAGAVASADGSTAAAGEGALLEGPRMLRAPQPPYPESARRSGAQGRVILVIVVGVDGSVRAAAIERSSGHPDLDAAALETIKTWRFQPGRNAHGPIAVTIHQPWDFKLLKSQS